MSFTYRGIPYEPTVTALPPSSQVVVGTYRGAAVMIPLPTHVPRRPELTHRLIYRGVRYGTLPMPVEPSSCSTPLA